MTLPAVILSPNTLPTDTLVGGLPLIVRHIKELFKLGVRAFYLDGIPQVPPEWSTYRLSNDIRLQPLPPSAESRPRHLLDCLPVSGAFLLLRGDCLIDPRLLAELLARSSPHWLRVPGMQPNTLPPAARLSPELLQTWATQGLDAWLQQNPPLQSESLDPYSRSHRGPVPVYVQEVQTPADATTATWTLIRSAQKRALDLPALVLHPWFENPLVYWLCPRRLTPNQITVFTTLLGALTAFLFLNGWLRVGILLAYVVAILDGVDGKLARTKLQTSRFGEFEHVFDFLVEHAWYLTLTIALVRRTGIDTLWWAGGGLMACDFFDNILYYLGQVYLGKQLDELGQFDRRFRLIGGRRNIYAWIFLVGFWVNVPVVALLMAAVWAALTMCIHACRLLIHVAAHSHERLLTPAGQAEQAGR